ncbi:unnamed protein product [Lasius platythorax]|uniref:Uncharacterized protein n=1 Tax=Lasius platythorax TaxID=488582 RepID=A0AAV2P742_9HYME
MNEIMGEIEKDELRTVEETSDKENQNIYEDNVSNVEYSVKRKKILKEGTTCMQARKITKVGKNRENLVSDEDFVKIERIKRIMEEEKEIADIRIAHEKTMAVMKENFHKELHTLEIRAAAAKAELAELYLQKEKEKEN